MSYSTEQINSECQSLTQKQPTSAKLNTNRGVIGLGDEGNRSDVRATLIVTGPPRSGTSIVAAALKFAGVFLGDRQDDIVHEDIEIAQAIESQDRQTLRSLIAARDQEHDVWGFKRPNLFAYLTADTLAEFRNPKIIISFRDPIAVVTRIMISESMNFETALRLAVANNNAALDFVTNTAMPRLLFSYDKVISELDEFMKILFSFCGLSVSSDEAVGIKSRVLGAQQNYLDHARARFRGVIDGMRGNTVVGWCAQIGSPRSLDIEVLVDGLHAAFGNAGLFRRDLEAAGVGQGRHGFAVDLGNMHLPQQAKIDVLIYGRTVRLHRGGRTAGELREELLSKSNQKTESGTISPPC